MCPCADAPTQVLPIVTYADPPAATRRARRMLALSYLAAGAGLLLVIVSIGTAMVGPENLARLV